MRVNRMKIRRVGEWRRRPVDRGKKAGIGLLILSGLLFGGVFVVPRMQASLVIRIATSAALYASSEITFWTGCLLIGRDVVRAWLHRLAPHRLLRGGGCGPRSNPSPPQSRLARSVKSSGFNPLL